MTITETDSYKLKEVKKAEHRGYPHYILTCIQGVGGGGGGLGGASQHEEVGVVNGKIRDTPRL